MAAWKNLGQMLRLNAKKYSSKVCLMDRTRRYAFEQTNERVNRLANSLVELGLQRGDTISVLLENCIEFVELYLAAAKTGLIVNPVNFRLVASEIAFVVTHADAKAFVVGAEFCGAVGEIRASLSKIETGRFVVVGDAASGYRRYEDLVEKGDAFEPDVAVTAADPWILLYTSGTTGKPKGVLRSHESYVAFYLISAVDFGFRPNDVVLNVMPLCHVNTTFFTLAMLYIGGSAFIHPASGFDARSVLAAIEESRASFISFVPTHYDMLLAVPASERARRDVSSVRKLLCSSAPARIGQKRAILEYFKGVELYESYGSTEAGIVTTLFPDEQLTKVGSIGRENLGTDCVRLLDENKQLVPRGSVGELYSCGPMVFSEYYKDPVQTAERHAGAWITAGDMAYEDGDGYYYLVDRKHNMIITGGEKVFPSEVETLIAEHPAVMDVAVIGVPDVRWGEAVKAVVVLKDGQDVGEEEILEFCRGRIAGYKRPKSVEFIACEDMPRTATGKILHRVLRDRCAR